MHLHSNKALPSWYFAVIVLYFAVMAQYFCYFNAINHLDVAVTKMNFLGDCLDWIVCSTAI